MNIYIYIYVQWIYVYIQLNFNMCMYIYIYIYMCYLCIAIQWYTHHTPARTAALLTWLAMSDGPVIHGIYWEIPGDFDGNQLELLGFTGKS